MRWGCPHCGINLAVSDDKIGTGWAFSKCYKCGGFALIRRSDVNLIKVDKAPAGENVILPEASEDPANSLLNHEAAQKLSKYVAPRAAEKPVIRPALRRSNAGISASTPTQAVANAMANAHAQVNSALNRDPFTQPAAPRGVAAQLNALGGGVAASLNALGGMDFGLPEPLPENPSRPIHYRALPFAIGLAGLVAVGSGIYLYIQGQALWEKARSNAASESREGANLRPVSLNSDARETNRDAAVAIQKPEAPSAAIAARGVSSSELIDQVHHNAMAPTRQEIEPAAAPIAPVLKIALKPAAVEVSANSPTAPASASFIVQPRIRRVNLHTGPGMQFPVSGMASAEIRYLVTDWNDRWFRIAIQEKPGVQKFGWIRNDLVLLVGSKDRTAKP